MRNKIADKEIYITKNTAKEKYLRPAASIFTRYFKDKNGGYARSREKVIGNTVYTVISREKENAEATAFDITKKMIERNIGVALRPPVRSEYKESFESCKSGGNKQ